MAMKLRPSRPVGHHLAPLAAAVGAVASENPAGSSSDLAAVHVTGVTLRGQDAQPGDLFAALPGASAHGARFAADAVAAGAVAVLTDPSGADLLAGTLDVPVLVHPAPRSVLGEAAAIVYGRPAERLRVVGVTGTSGKIGRAHV